MAQNVGYVRTGHQWSHIPRPAADGLTSPLLNGYDTLSKGDGLTMFDPDLAQLFGSLVP